MYQRDFILRMIEQAMQALSLMLGLIDRKKYQEALNVANDLYYNTFNIDSDYFDNLQIDEMYTNLTTELGLKPNEVETIARFLKAEGDVYTGMGNYRKATVKYSGALELFYSLNEIPDGILSLDRMRNIDLTEKSLKELDTFLE